MMLKDSSSLQLIQYTICMHIIRQLSSLNIYYFLFWQCHPFSTCFHLFEWNPNEGHCTSSYTVLKVFKKKRGAREFNSLLLALVDEYRIIVYYRQESSEREREREKIPLSAICRPTNRPSVRQTIIYKRAWWYRTVQLLGDKSNLKSNRR